jgi:hypothetical protein
MVELKNLVTKLAQRVRIAPCPGSGDFAFSINDKLHASAKNGDTNRNSTIYPSDRKCDGWTGNLKYEKGANFLKTKADWTRMNEQIWLVRPRQRKGSACPLLRRNRPRDIGARLDQLIQQYLVSGIIDIKRIKKKHD